MEISFNLKKHHIRVIKLSAILIVLNLCSSCAQETSKVKPLATNVEALWGPISLKNWKKTSATNNRIANEQDVMNGNAVFYIEGSDKEHKNYPINLPKLAHLTDYETNEKSLVVIIQMEIVPDKGTVVGYRSMTGGNGAGLLEEFEILSDEKIKKLYH